MFEVAMPQICSASMLPVDAPGSVDELFDTVYDQLKSLASRQLARGKRGTLDTTELVHEVYLRLNRGAEVTFEHRRQFFTYAARALRHVLADRARNRMRKKAAGTWARVSLTTGADTLAIESAEQALALDDALARLEQTDARAANVVELRYFAGMSPDQTAEVLGIARRTVDRDWRYALAFLHAALN
jgi:RNA polymerase sigma factor (TIGR02999 family)